MLWTALLPIGQKKVVPKGGNHPDSGFGRVDLANAVPKLSYLRQL